MPESFRVLIKEFQALGLDIQILTKGGGMKELKDLEAEEDKLDTPISIDEIDLSREEEPIVEPGDIVEEEFEDEENEFDEFSESEEEVSFKEGSEE